MKKLFILIVSLMILGLEKNILLYANTRSLPELLGELKCDYPSESQLYYNNLNSQEKQHYDYLLSQTIQNDFGTPIVFLFYNLSEDAFAEKRDELTNSLFAFGRERKEFFWITGSYRLNIIKTGFVNSEVSDYEVTVSLLVTEFYLNEDESIKKELIKTDLIRILAVIEQITTETLALNTEYEKYKYIHDWLVINNDYELTNDLSHTPVSALLDDRGGTVCEAYAEAFLVLALKANLNVAFVTGKARSDLSSYEDHAWNNVKLGSYWYLVDVTWDDPVGAPEGYIGYTYFLVPNINEVYRTINQENINPTPFAIVAFDNIPSYEVLLYLDDELVKTLYITYGGNLVVPSDLKREGYSIVFSEDTTNITEDKTFYGSYVINQYTIRFFVDNVLYDEQTVNYNQMPLIPEELSKEGYIFKGWNKQITSATKDMDYHAVFQKITNPFNFNNLNDTGKIIIIGVGFVLAISLLIGFVKLFTRRRY